MDREKAEICASLHTFINKYIIMDYNNECVLVVFERFIVEIILQQDEPKKLLDEFIEKLIRHFKEGPDGF